MIIMNVGFNNSYRSYDQSKISFKSNKGFLNAVEALKTDGGPKNIRKLQAQAEDVNLTPEFLATIENIKPSDIKTLAKKVLGLIPKD